jgi:hypothetical protein
MQTTETAQPQPQPEPEPAEVIEIRKLDRVETTATPSAGGQC